LSEVVPRSGPLASLIRLVVSIVAVVAVDERCEVRGRFSFWDLVQIVGLKPREGRERERGRYRNDVAQIALKRRAC